MAVAFILKSDKEFISPDISDHKHIIVYQFEGDVNDVQLIRSAMFREHWRYEAFVGPESLDYKALQVFGVTIDGDKLGELARELRGIEEGNNVDVFVNRLGLCIIRRIRHPSIKYMRINDYFGWSKYGVRVPRDMISSTTFNVWNKIDMFNGETMMDLGGIVGAAGEAKELRRRMEEQSKELRACKEELVWNSVVSVPLCRMAVEEQDKEVEKLENQLVALKAALREALIG